MKINENTKDVKVIDVKIAEHAENVNLNYTISKLKDQVYLL
jgi:hypothetical protein